MPDVPETSAQKRFARGPAARRVQLRADGRYRKCRGVWGQAQKSPATGSAEALQAKRPMSKARPPRSEAANRARWRARLLAAPVSGANCRSAANVRTMESASGSLIATGRCGKSTATIASRRAPTAVDAQLQLDIRKDTPRRPQRRKRDLRVRRCLRANRG